MFKDLALLFSIVSFLYVWFNTDAFIEYGRLFRLKFLRYEDYERSKKTLFASTIPNYNYLTFIGFEYDNFLVRIIVCPICLAVWVNLISIGVIYHSLGAYKLFGFNLIATWLGYFLLAKLIKKLNE